MKQTRIEKYFYLTRVSFLQGLKSYKTLCGLGLLLITCLLIFSKLWKVVASKTGVMPFSPEELLWYIALNEWILIAIPDMQIEIEQDLKSGQLACVLSKPISYLNFKFFQGLGTLLVQLFFLAILTFSFTALMTNTFPFTLSSLLFALFLGSLAGIVFLLFQLLIGMLALWFHEVGPIQWIWQKLSFLFGGLFIPLSLYPLWMQNIGKWTPFPALIGERSASIFSPTLNEAGRILFLLMMWGIISYFLLVFTYKRLVRSLNIHGG